MCIYNTITTLRLRLSDLLKCGFKDWQRDIGNRVYISRCTSEASSNHDAAGTAINLQERVTPICEAQGNIVTMIIDFRNVIEICEAVD